MPAPISSTERRPARLTVLGGLALAADCPEVRVTRAYRLALLAILAAHGERGLSRDSLQLLLWPDRDAERAGASLSQLLYGLRADLRRPDAIVAAGAGALRLDAAVVSSDVRDFERALERADDAEAVARYGGPFLEGFHLAASAEFERWVDATRARLADQYAAALERLAVGAAALGDAVGALEWWRRRAAHDPLDARVAREVVRAHAAVGDRAGAVRHAREHEQRSRAELGVAPDPHLVALVAELRVDRDASARAPATASPASTPAAPEASVPAAPSAGADRERRLSTPPSAPDEPRMDRSTRRGRASAWRAAVGVAAAAVVLAVVAVRWRTVAAERAATSAPWGSPVPDSTVRVAVFPFAVLDGAHAEEGDAVALLLAAGIDGTAGVRVVDARSFISATAPRAVLDPTAVRPLARARGAHFFVIGEVVQEGERLRLTGALYPVAGGVEPQATVRASGTAASLMSLADSLSWQLLAARGAGQPGRLASAASRGTASLDAFRAYLDGERSFRRGRFGEAISAFRRAVAIDSSFALAYYRLSVVADWAAMGGEAEGAREQAVAHSARLPERERLLIAADGQWWRGETADAERLVQHALQLYPDDPQAAYQLGEIIFHSGPAIGQAPTDARPLFARAVALEPQNLEAIAHLARIEMVRGHLAEADSLVRRVQALHPGPHRIVEELELMVAMAHGAAAEARPAVVAGRRPGDELPLYLAAWRLAAYTGRSDQAAEFARWLAERSANPQYRMRSRLRLGEFALDAGRLDDALREASDPPLGPGWLLGFRAWLVALPFSGADRRTLAAYADSLGAWRRVAPPAGITADEADANGATPGLADYPAALLALRLGDTIAARRHAAKLARAGSTAEERSLARGLAHGIEAELAWAGHQPAAALAAFDSAMAVIPLRYRLDVFGGSMALQRYRRAFLLRELGRESDARRWLATFDGSDSAGERPFHRPVALARSAWAQSARRPPARRDVERLAVHDRPR